MSDSIFQALDAIEFVEHLQRTIEECDEDWNISSDGVDTTTLPEMSVPNLEAPLNEDVWTMELQEYRQVIAEREADAEGSFEDDEPVTSQPADAIPPRISSKVEYGPSIRYAIKESPENPQPIKPWLIGFGFWCDSVGISWKDYLGLVELFDIATVEDLKGLPRTLHTLQKRYREHLPFTGILEKTIPLQADKIPTGQKAEGPVYFFDQVQLVRNMLNSRYMMEMMYFGMAKLVDEPSELWESFAWAEGIRSCSGEFMQYHDCKPVFPSHFIEYKCEFEDCPCRSSGQAKHLGRIRAVAKDERSTTIKATEKGKPVALVIPLMPPRYLEPEHQEALSEYLDDFCALEGFYHHVTSDRIVSRRLDVGFNRITLSNTSDSSPKRILIKRIYNMKTKTSRDIRLAHAIRAEIEIDIYGESYLEEFFVTSEEEADVAQSGSKASPNRPLCIPHLTFLDGFGLYRNMYRSLMGQYSIRYLYSKMPSDKYTTDRRVYYSIKSPSKASDKASERVSCNAGPTWLPAQRLYRAIIGSIKGA